MNWANKIFKKHSTTEFEDLAFDVFNYQMNHCVVYSDYACAIGKVNPSSLTDIPFLPISFFKSKRIFSNQFSEMDWSKYDSSRYPLHYFLTKIYLPLDLNIIKFNNFLMSMFIPIILFFSLKKKILFHKIYNQNLLLLTLCFIFYLSPYLRTSSYWMLEENFGIFFIILSSIFFYNSFLGKGFNQYLNIFIYLLLSYFAFFCSQNLFVFIVVNFFIYINFFLKKKNYCFFNNFDKLFISFFALYIFWRCAFSNYI